MIKFSARWIKFVVEVKNSFWKKKNQNDRKSNMAEMNTIVSGELFGHDPKETEENGITFI